MQYSMVKILLAKNYTNMGILKKIMRSIEYRTGSAFESKNKEGNKSREVTPEKSEKGINISINQSK